MRFGTILENVAATFAGSFGMLAMLLAVVGIYGVVSYSTRQRTREIGIRMSLGAAKGQIYRLVLAQGLRLTLAGLVVGVVLSLVLTRVLKSKLYGVSSTDALTYFGVATALSVVALVACHIPARRATKVQPTVAAELRANGERGGVSGRLDRSRRGFRSRTSRASHPRAGTRHDRKE